jgi:hypothetical protein
MGLREDCRKVTSGSPTVNSTDSLVVESSSTTGAGGPGVIISGASLIGSTLMILCAVNAATVPITLLEVIPYVKVNTPW